MADITRIAKDSVSELVYNQLRDNVMSGKWLTGDKIPSENQLAELFGVSRMSVRVGIKKMITLGLLEARVGEGTFVKEFKPGNCLNELAPMVLKPKNQIEILEYRKALETEVIRLAIKRASNEEIQNLETIYQNMCKACRNSDIAEYFRLDHDFHYFLFKMSKNGMLISTFEMLKELMFTHYFSTVKDSWEAVGIPELEEDDEHYDILQGLKKRDVNLSLRAYIDMIDGKIAFYEKQLKD
jgi:GntR family transcriptional regulator, transcriptional repressor for pyruvate dehydrogenase complex